VFVVCVFLIFFFFFGVGSVRRSRLPIKQWWSVRENEMNEVGVESSETNWYMLLLLLMMMMMK